MPDEDRPKSLTFEDLVSDTHPPSRLLRMWRWVWAGIRVVLDAIFYGAPGS